MPNLEQYLLRTVPLVRNDKTEIKELNSLSIVRISISTYTQTRKRRVGSRMARISVAYSKSLRYLKKMMNFLKFLELNWLLSTQTNRDVFKVDRLQTTVVAKKYIYVPELFISRTPKTRTTPQLVSAPLNPIPIAEHSRRSHPPCEHSRGQHTQVRKITQSKTKTPLNELNAKPEWQRILSKKKKWYWSSNYRPNVILKLRVISIGQR